MIKDIWFPDMRTHKMASVGSHTVLFTILIAYWMIPLPLALGYGINKHSTLSKIIIIGTYIIGAVVNMGSDYTKYQILSKKRGRY